jgi:hypothetical protein
MCPWGNRSQDCDGYTHFHPSDYEKATFEMSLTCVCMSGDYVRMCSPLVPEWYDGLYSNSVFKSLSVPCRCLGTMNYSSSKNKGTSNAPSKRISLNVRVQFPSFKAVA